MANNNRLTYFSPKDKFEKIHMNVILKFDADVVGIYCKLVTMSQGKSLSISWLSKKLGINERRMRKTIVLLEEEGYITRKPMKDEKGRITAWNYELYAEPVRKDNRTHPGRKSTLSETHLDRNPPCTKTTKVENGEDNNIYTKSISINNTDLDLNTEKVLSDDNTKNALSEEEQIYRKKMKERFPHIMRMEEPLTLEQAKKLKDKYDSDLLTNIMNEMENWKPLVKKNISAYKTIINWCDRELNRV